MNPIHIVCTIDDAYVQHCGVMLCSLLENNPQNSFEIYIIHDGLTIHNQQKLQVFLKKQYQQAIHFIKFDKSKVSGFPRKASDHVSLVTYYRLFLADILPSTLDKVLFLDPDLIIQADITELWQTDLQEYSLAAVENPDSETRKTALAIPATAKYFNAGVLLIHLKKWRQNQLTTSFIDCIKTKSNNLQFWDQDVLNTVLWNDCQNLPNTWNTIKYFENTTPKIVHFVGTRKPWHYKSQHPYRSTYFHYLKMTPWRSYSPLKVYLGQISHYYYQKIFSSKLKP